VPFRDTNAKGGLRVDYRQGLIAGGGRGRGNCARPTGKSLLLKAINQTDKLKMLARKETVGRGDWGF